MKRNKNYDEIDNPRSYYAYVNWRDRKLRSFELEYKRTRERLEAAQKAERKAWKRYYEERKRLSVNQYFRTIESKTNGR